MPGGNDVLRTVRVAHPHGEQRRGRHAVATGGAETEGDRRGDPLLRGHVEVGEQPEVAPVVVVAPTATVPNPDSQREPFKCDRVVGQRLTLALEPDDQAVRGGGHELGVELGRITVHHAPARTHAQHPTRVLLAEAGRAPGQRCSGGEEATRVDVADDQLVETGDHPQPQTGAGIETRDAAQQLLHVSSSPAQSPRIFSTHVSRAWIIERPTAVCGAKMSQAWNAPAHTCSSALPPARQMASA